MAILRNTVKHSTKFMFLFHVQMTFEVYLLLPPNVIGIFVILISQLSTWMFRLLKQSMHISQLVTVTKRIQTWSGFFSKVCMMQNKVLAIGISINIYFEEEGLELVSEVHDIWANDDCTMIAWVHYTSMILSWHIVTNSFGWLHSVFC